MNTLLYYPGTAAMIPHILLEEIGEPYERVLIDRTVAAHKAPAYLQLNPNGLIPVLTDGDLVLYETAAICLHLCDTHPQAGLAPALGTAQRAQFYKWLVWMTNTLQSTLIIYFYPERWAQEGDAPRAAEVRAIAAQKIAGMLDQLDAELARHGQAWLGGADYSAPAQRVADFLPAAGNQIENAGRIPCLFDQFCQQIRRQRRVLAGF